MCVCVCERESVCVVCVMFVCVCELSLYERVHISFQAERRALAGIVESCHAPCVA